MKLDDAARQLVETASDATLVTINPDGSPQVTMVWTALDSTPDGDELVVAHLSEHKKVRNIRRDARVAVTIAAPPGHGQPMTPYLAIQGTAYITDGGAPDLLRKLAATRVPPGVPFPPDNPPPGYLTHIRIDKVGGVGPWAA